MAIRIPRLIIAAPMSGSGKTTITAGLIAAFVARGVRVAPFKVGPDYIDPTYHALAAQRACSNLDAWMLPEARVQAVFAHRAQDADLALIEGVMGLFDGFSGREDTGSTAHIARLLNTPVLLVLDARAMARSAAAIVLGMCKMDPRVRVVGVILNRVGSAKHAQLVTDAIQERTRIPVLGHLLREPSLELPERHLGLIPTLEAGRWAEWLEQARSKISATVNLEQVYQLAQATPALDDVFDNPFVRTAHATRATIAVARDQAFNFLYEDNLDLLRAVGAEIVFFSPLYDAALPPNTQALYLAGGFPEIYAEQLAANEKMRHTIRAASAQGMPIYAECGGLMYLTQAIADQQGRVFPMVGILPGRSTMTSRLTLGYRIVRAVRDNWLLRAGEVLRGHEFHYSTWEWSPNPNAAVYQVVAENGSRIEGMQIGNVIASYVHLHFLAHSALAHRFVAAAQSWGKNG